MKDTEIIELFLKRDREAIRESETKYAHLLTHIAGNILVSKEDVEECVNDTYMKLWDSIPPNQPESLKNYAARIVRNLAIDYYRHHTAICRNNEVVSITEELSEIIADRRNDYEQAEFDSLINSFLEGLDKESRVLFVKRYWQSESITALADMYGMKESAVKMRLLRIRKRFREYLKDNDVVVQD